MAEACPINVLETERGLRVALPPRFWLLVSLRRLVRRLLPDEAAWTYFVPAAAAVKLEQWIAEVELQIAAEARRRAWSATDAEWVGASEAATVQPWREAFAPFVISVPSAATTRGTLKLIEQLRAGEILTATLSPDGDQGRAFRLLPSGLAIQARVAERAIADGLIRPACDGLFGPETSQSWDLPADEQEASVHG